MPPFADLRHGDCRDIIATLDDNSIDAIVTDPPYELGFMGKGWDNTGIAYDVQLWTECLRVLKPGGHLLAFGGTRTYHRMTSAIEDAGFEIRDSIHWIYGSGFPKSHDVSKGIDKAAGAQREVVGSKMGRPGYSLADNGRTNEVYSDFHDPVAECEITAPATDAAREWEGWGTALKPAHEPIVMARKPLVGTVAANVLQHGTGALNIDGARIGYQSEADKAGAQALADLRAKGLRLGVIGEPGQGSSLSVAASGDTRNGTEQTRQSDAGRWPANVILDGSIEAEWVRYFYCAKASKAERNAGGTIENRHPTVKPLALMRYLVRLVTPPGGTVLEPFAGSGTTLAAAILEGFNVIGCELTADYLPIIEGRIAWAQQQYIEAHDNLFGENV